MIIHLFALILGIKPKVKLVHSKLQARKTPDPLNYAATHQEIIDNCRQGNRQAQFELYRLYSKAMYNICLRMLKDEMNAEDILQNSFIDVFTKLHTFQHQSAIGAWIKSDKKHPTFSTLICSDKLLKHTVETAHLLGVKTIVSRFAPTDLAFDLAQQYTIDIVGFARGIRFNQY